MKYRLHLRKETTNCIVCRNLARWIDTASVNIYYCDKCVRRGCSCNPPYNNSSRMHYIRNTWRAWINVPCCEYSRIRPVPIPNKFRKRNRSMKKAYGNGTPGYSFVRNYINQDNDGNFDVYTTTEDQ